MHPHHPYSPQAKTETWTAANPTKPPSAVPGVTMVGIVVIVGCVLIFLNERSGAWISIVISVFAGAWGLALIVEKLVRGARS